MEEITVKEAARRIGVTPVMVRRYIENGSLKAVKVGDLWLIHPAEMERFKRPAIGRPRNLSGEDRRDLAAAERVLSDPMGKPVPFKPGRKPKRKPKK